ncbi:g7946 [Coccomyxa viridis]|uniref:G7946 protein n=1 Tax=Coccomyxa viridis TaxID=1274662 RepID=A0ABP1G377_9CHLO
MDDPRRELPELGVVLFRGTRAEQEKLVHSLYTVASSFSHPFFNCIGRDEIAAAYDYFVHAHRKVAFTCDDIVFIEEKSLVVIFDFNPRFWPRWWPFGRHAYAPHYDIKLDLCKEQGRWRIVRQHMGVQQRTALTACVGHVMRTNLFKFASPQLLTDGYHELRPAQPHRQSR